ncbi:delta 1-pyrroline-5-carboxylate synthetase [Methanobrevibacter sp. 87.7]|nr:delta 1-pyrroline-5-carboxylate synthetase [Methanobrevibacter sp. 87.7]
MEWVVKIGGSLFPTDAIKVAEKLKGTNSLIITGGGEFANLIRRYDKSKHFSPEITDETAIECMTIISKLLNDKVNHCNIVYSIDDARKVSDNGNIPILICSEILKEYRPFEKSWDVSSDSISAYIAYLLNAKLLIVTNVNGIYTRRPKTKGSKFIEKIDAKKLLTFDETSIDLMLPSLLIKFGADCFIVNGKYPERVYCIVNNINPKDYNFKYTYIKGV